MSRMRRSLLFVPGSEERKLAKVPGLRADSIILDLEDGVAPDRKDAARELVAAFLRGAEPAPAERLVRVNGLRTRHCARDLQAIAPAGPAGIVLPKVEGPDEVREVEALLDRAGAAPTVRILPLIETARGILQSAAIAAASPRVEALILGHADLCQDLRVGRLRAGDGIIQHARCQMVLAARAAGKEAIDTVFLDLDDLPGLEAEAREAARLGFGGKLAIHPGQVEVIHRAFTPDPEAVRYAERLVAAWEAALSDGKGIIIFEGRMIDIPVVEVERRVLERARMAGLA